MGFTLSVPDRQYRLDSEAAQGPQTPTDPSMFQGTGSAVGTGVVGGGAAVARTAANAVNFLGRVAGVQEAAEADPTSGQAEQLFNAPAMKPAFDDQIQAVQDWAKADPSAQGSGARVLGSTARGITILGGGSLFGGPVAGAGTLATVEGYNTYRDVQQGPNPVDQATALKMGGLTAAAAGLGAFLPLKLGSSAATSLAGLGMRAEVAGNGALATSLFGAARAAATVSSTVVGRLGTAAAVNTGFGVANRFATSAVLENAGYKDMAAQYAPLDAEALTADFVMGLAFGGHAEFAGHGAPARTEVDPAAKPPPSMVEAALASRRQEMLARNGVGVPIDPAHANLDTSLQDGALSDLLRGREVSVSPDNAKSIVEGALPDPARAVVNDEYLAAAEAEHGLLADFSEPERVPPKAAEPPTSREESAAPPAAEGAAGIDPLAAESMHQIAGAHPDLPVDLGNGVQVRAADLPKVLAQEMASANNDAKLHDVAMACFLRT